jgi:hypothetical protein
MVFAAYPSTIARWCLIREPPAGSGLVIRPIAIHEYVDGSMAGSAGDLSPELQLALFDLIQLRNKAEPDGPP